MSDMDGTAQGAPTGQTQPGWYPDPTNGQLRWWDGTQWGQFQNAGAVPGGMGGMAPVPTAQNSQSSAAMAHYLGAGALVLTCGGLGWVGPLIIMLTQGQNDPYVKDQATEALNFQITVAIGIYVSYFLMIILIGFLTWGVVLLGGIILGIMGGSAASKGELYRYPMSFRIIK